MTETTNRAAPEATETRLVTAALRRASRRALEEARATGTPFDVWKDGRVVDLNATPKPRRRRARRARSS